VPGSARNGDDHVHVESNLSREPEKQKRERKKVKRPLQQPGRKVTTKNKGRHHAIWRHNGEARRWNFTLNTVLRSCEITEKPTKHLK
jgi:hypothetical protein